MSANDNDPFDTVIAGLERLATFTERDRAAIRALPLRIVDAPAGYHLVHEGDRPTDCCILLRGYACRSKITNEGARQIVSFNLMGDVLGLQHLMLPRADHSITTITDATLAFVPAERVRALREANPAVNDALWRHSLIEGAIAREWVLNVGRRDAKTRLAHMLCEFAARREAAGLGSVDRFDLPMTQEQIADATGMTAIHVNRTLHALAEDGVIARNRRDVHIVDWDRMRALAGFDPGYLHLAA